MAINNVTLETINYVKTIDAEFNMKILLIFIFFCYALVLFWLDRKYFKEDPRASFKLLGLGSKIYYWTYFLFLPTFIYQLPITQDMGFLLLYQTYLYSIGAVYAILVLAIWLIEQFFLSIGWEITFDKGLKIDRKWQEVLK